MGRFRYGVVWRIMITGSSAEGACGYGDATEPPPGDGKIDDSKSEGIMGFGVARSGRWRPLHPILTIVFVLCSGCGDTGPPAAPQQAGLNASVALEGGNPYPPGRDEFAHFEIARHTPWFGGVLLDGDRLIVTVTDETRSSEVVEALAGWIEQLRESRALPDVQVATRWGRYGFGELSVWMERATDFMRGNPNVYFVDLNEDANMIDIGVDDPGSIQMLADLQAVVRAPANAVRLVRGGRAGSDRGVALAAFELDVLAAQSSGTLGQTFQPIPGGVGGLAALAGGAFAPCTFGFPARFGGVSGPNGFVTAAHCSASFGQVNTGTFRQFTASNPAGTEQIDHRNVCGSKCKWADAAWYSYVSGRSGDLALVARTQDSLGNLQASRTLHGTLPRFQVEGKLSNPLMNEVVYKMGNDRGWSTGVVTRTCVTNQPTDPLRVGFTLKCQDYATYVRGAGDSGGPVFRRVASPNVVRIMGIHNGVDTNTGEAIFSAMANIEVDFGSAAGNANLYVGPWIQ